MTDEQPTESETRGRRDSDGHVADGQAVVRLLSTVDALLDPPGCEWNRAQTHRSLVTYLVEESFELVEAIEDGDTTDLREELGDVLYQVVLHAGIAEREGAGFGLAEVAAEVDEKIRRRHPHVFGADQPGNEAHGVDDIVRLWSAAKAREKAGRSSVYDGVPVGLPALARAQKLLSRAGAQDPDGLFSPRGDASDEAGLATADTEDAWGERLLAEVERASSRGFDAERALRGAVRAREASLRRAEGGRAASAAPRDVGRPD